MSYPYWQAVRREIIETCGSEEQEYADNMPENMQGNENHEKAETCSQELESVGSDIEDLETRLQECME